MVVATDCAGNQDEKTLLVHNAEEGSANSADARVSGGRWCHILDPSGTPHIIHGWPLTRDDTEVQHMHKRHQQPTTTIYRK